LELKQEEYHQRRGAQRKNQLWQAGNYSREPYISSADKRGNVLPVHSISAGLDLSSSGGRAQLLPEKGIAQYVTCTDDQALSAFKELTMTEGIILLWKAATHLDSHSNQDRFRGKKF
jgi:tryptophan synthase beta subunit